MLACGERCYGHGSTLYVRLSSFALLPWLPVFPLQAFPTPVSSLTFLWPISPQSTGAFTLGLLTIPKLQLPATAPLGNPGSCQASCQAVARTVWFSPHLGCHRSAFSALNIFSSDSNNCPTLEIRPLLQFPQSPRAGPILLTLLFFPLVPLSYQVLRGSIYSFPLVRSSCLL